MRDTIFSLKLRDKKVKDELTDLLCVAAQHLLKQVVEKELRSSFTIPLQTTLIDLDTLFLNN